MNIRHLADELGLKVLTGEDLEDREAVRGCCCDLLSWVMAHGTESDVWITVQTHVNVVAVAALLDIACVIIPENIQVEQKTLKKAQEENVIILGSSLTAYELCGKLYQMGIGSAS